MTEISKKTGDYSSLSLTDLKVIALTHDLHIEHCGSAGINYDVKPNIQTVERQSQKLDANLPGFHDPQKEVCNQNLGYIFKSKFFDHFVSKFWIC